MVAKCSIHTRVEAGRGAAGAAVEATLRLAEIIAVMDRSYSPEHAAPAAAQQDDFADLHTHRQTHTYSLLELGLAPSH